jgi:hypothetical protein
MCGIVGYSFSDKCTLSHEQKKRLLLVGSVGADRRGGQSFGWCIADPSGPIVHRDLGPLVSADFNILANSQLGFLHSRFATQGTITVRNSHPFEIGHLIGAHNGVLANSQQLDRMFGPKEVDSEHIFHRIAEGDNLEQIEGYGVIEYMDKRANDRIFLVNVGGGSVTLWEIWDDNDQYFQGFFWTSLKEDGELALASAGIKNYEAFELKEGEVYVFLRGIDEVYTLQDTKLKVSSARNSNVWTSGSHKIDWDNFDSDFSRDRRWNSDLNMWDQLDKDDDKDLDENPSMRERAFSEKPIADQDSLWESYKDAKGLDFDSADEEQEFKEVFSEDYLDSEYSEIQKALKKTG